MPTDKPSAERARAREEVYAFMDLHPTMDAVDRMALYAALAVEREREACAKAVCELCAENVPREQLTNTHGKLYWHHHSGKKWEHTGDCDASEIWARDAERG